MSTFIKKMYRPSRLDELYQPSNKISSAHSEKVITVNNVRLAKIAMYLLLDSKCVHRDSVVNLKRNSSFSRDLPLGRFSL